MEPGAVDRGLNPMSDEYPPFIIHHSSFIIHHQGDWELFCAPTRCEEEKS